MRTQSLGDGFAALVLGRDFTCANGVCSGLGTTNVNLLKQLQRQLNQFAPALGFPFLDQDGKFGTKTQDALQRTAALIEAADPDRPAVIGDALVGMSANQIAVHVRALIDVLTRELNLLTTTADPAQPTSRAPSRAWLWLSFGLGIVACAATGVVLYRRTDHAHH